MKPIETTIEALRLGGAEFEGKTIQLKGWLFNQRSSGKIKFLQVRDGTGIIQCVVVRGEAPDEVFENSGKLTQESSLTVTGVVRQDKRSPIGWEMGVSDLQIVQIAEEFPIGKKEHGVAFLMEHRHLWFRSRRQMAILRIRAEVIKAIADAGDRMPRKSTYFYPKSPSGLVFNRLD